MHVTLTLNRKGHVTLAITRQQSLCLYKHNLSVLGQTLCVFKRSLNYIVKDLSSINGLCIGTGRSEEGLDC